MFPLGSRGPVGSQLGMMRCFFHGPSFERLVRSRLRQVKSLRHVVSGMTIKHISPHRMMRLGITLRTVRPVGRTYRRTSGPDLGQVNRRLGLYVSVHSQVRGRVGGSPPLLVGGKKIVGSNMSARLSRLQRVTCSNGSCLLGVRRHRDRLAKVPDLGVTCGDIFKCCVRIQGIRGSGIPRR